MTLVKKNNKEDPKFKFNEHVRIPKYENIFAKVYFPNWSEEVFVIERFLNTVLWTFVISDLKDEKIVETFYKNELPKTNQIGIATKIVIEKRW